MTETRRSKVVQHWVEEIERYDRDTKKWVERSRKIRKMYSDDNGSVRDERDYNMLWSNIEILKPAVYSKPPKASVDQRWKKKDKVARIASEVLERSIDYCVDTTDFNEVMSHARDEWLLTARGTAWVRYEPTFVTGQIPDGQGEKTEYKDAAPLPPSNDELAWEKVIWDFLHQEDFGHTFGRTWREVEAVWRRAYMTRGQLEKRFGELGTKIELDYYRAPEEKKAGKQGDKAIVYEIWNKPNNEVIWMAKGHPDVLDRQAPILTLKDFFPCPRPLYGTLDNTKLIPTPDYVYYQVQAEEIENITRRIRSLSKSLKLAGVYDSSCEGIQRILNDGIDNQLLPIDTWAAFAEKGGLKGAVDWLPMEQVAKIIQTLYQTRDAAKNEVYEIMGLSDLMRGMTSPTETLGAQQLKSQYGSKRAEERIKEMARFARDCIDITGEIIAEKFQLETIREMSGYDLMTMEEKQMAQEEQALNAQSEQPPEQDPEQILLLDEPAWEDIYKFLQDDALRRVRIDIETDSTTSADQALEKQGAVEYIGAISQFLQQAAPLAQTNPELTPVLGEGLLFISRRFKAGRAMEGVLETVLDKFEDARKAQEQGPQEPSPQDIEMQKQSQRADEMHQATLEKTQAETQKLSAEATTAQDKADLESFMSIQDILARHAEMNRQLTEAQQQGLVAADPTTQSVLDLHGKLDMQNQAQAETTNQMTQGLQMMAQSLGQVSQLLQQSLMQQTMLSEQMAAQSQALQSLYQVATTPKEIQVDRDENGRMLGARQVTPLLQ